VNPPLTILINAFGRTWILAEALESALRQDYAGDIEILIVNDFHLQNLLPPMVVAPRRIVRVVNLLERHKSLGSKRNAGVLLATHDRILLADDDDIMLPWSARTLMGAHLDSNLPAWEGTYFYTERWPPDWRVQRLNAPTAQHGLITRQHWHALGGFIHSSTRDDIDFLDRACERWGRHRLVVPVEQPGYLYRWGTDTHHLSGMSECLKTWEHAYRVARDGVQSGEEPGGNVILKPAWKVDYVAALRQGGYIP